ncbi:MAG: hypothetical protein FWD97_09525 [Defluviitaleaceae bacterium]|nr:hypothetical protein [Defluviitaleaceae bacterium]
MVHFGAVASVAGAVVLVLVVAGAAVDLVVDFGAADLSGAVVDSGGSP